ncbi:MAG: DUF6503 family protein [Flavobacteriaceae bacterium]
MKTVQQKIRRMHKLSGLVLALLFSLNCQHEESAEEIIQKSIKAHGFSPQKTPISFTKSSQLYFRNGSLEKSTHQKHQIAWSPFSYQITEKTAQGTMVITQRNDQYSVEINGKAITDTIGVQNAKNALKAAFFVFWQPAKLRDKKAKFRYLGKKKLIHEKMVNAIEVYYPKSTSTDKWEFYFDTESYLNIGYSVKHKGRWSLILNDAFHREHRPILVKERRSFLIDSTNNSTVLRATYAYRILP